MSLKKYNKRALTFEEQIKQLEERGLDISNKEKALHLFQNIGYYRLSGYWYPLLAEPKSDHIFKPKSNFTKAFALYCFDKELRILISTEIEKIEVAVRARLINVFSLKYGPFWFTDSKNFSSSYSQFERTIEKVNTEYRQNDSDFINAFRKKYSDNYPPSWMMLEILSFGTLSKIYANFAHTQSKRIVAKQFGVSDEIFESWLHTIVYVRNLCAHHSRVWNRIVHIQPKTPRTLQLKWVKESGTNDRIYPVLCVIRYFLLSVNPNSSFPEKLKNLMKSYSMVDHQAMGFASDWQADDFWK